MSEKEEPSISTEAGLQEEFEDIDIGVQQQVPEIMAMTVSGGQFKPKKPKMGGLEETGLAGNHYSLGWRKAQS